MRVVAILINSEIAYPLKLEKITGTALGNGWFNNCPGNNFQGIGVEKLKIILFFVSQRVGHVEQTVIQANLSADAMLC